MHFTPPGHKIEYLTKRHWYEILPETMDMLCGVAVIVSICWSLSWLLFEPKILVGIVLTAYPILHLVVELIEWNHELYVVTRDMDGDGWVFKRKGWLGHYQIADYAGSMSIIERTPLLGRILGFTQVELRSDKHSYIEGRLVPRSFIEKIFEVQVSEPEPDEEGKDTFILKKIDVWVDKGLVERNQARQFLAKQMA